jgi:hypothetical protein
MKKEEIRDLYMDWLMKRVVDSGVTKEESIKKAADIFMEDFAEFAKVYKELVRSL